MKTPAANRKSGWKTKLLLRPVVISFLLAISLLLLSIYSTAHTRAYNSDDVRWSNILLTWKPFSGQLAGLGDSTSIVHLPLLALLGHYFKPSRTLLTVESSCLAVLGFTAFYISSLYFMWKARVRLSYANLLPFVWLGSFGYNFVQLYLDPTWRGFDVGLSFVTFMLVAMVLYGDVNPFSSWLSKSSALLSIIMVGTLSASDSTYTYFTLGPIVVFSAVLFGLRYITRRQIVIIYSGVAVSLVVAKLVLLLCYKAGIRLQQSLPAEFVSFDKLATNVMTTLHGLLMIFGADFCGNPVVSLLSVSALINATILAFILWKSRRIMTLTPPPESIERLTWAWQIFFICLSLFIFVLYASSTLVGITAYRYLFMMVPALVLLLGLVLGMLRAGKTVIVSILVLGTVLNIFLSLRFTPGFLQAGSLGNPANKVNYEIINAVEARGYSKGYGIYWQAQINTYLSGNQVNFLPVLCAAGQTSLYYWVINESRFSVPASKSFYIVDPDYPGQVCTTKQVIKQFGEPLTTTMVANKTILFYGYDLTTKM